jgi:hypothetical protein
MRFVDDGQVEELRGWARGLATDDRPEVRAAARAILMLADDVLAARSQLLEERLIREALEDRAEMDANRPDVVHALAGRLRSLLRRPAESPPAPEPPAAAHVEEAVDDETAPSR